MFCRSLFVVPRLGFVWPSSLYRFWLPLWYLLTLLMVATITWLAVANYLCHKWPQICSVCHNYTSFLSSFMIYNVPLVCTKITTTGATSALEIAKLFWSTGGHPPTFCGPLLGEGGLSSMLYIIACPSLFIVLSIVRYTASDFPLCIFKVFWYCIKTPFWPHIERIYLIILLKKRKTKPAKNNKQWEPVSDT